MTTLKREEWHDITRLTDWTFSHVDDDAVFPDWMAGRDGTDRESWHTWKEDYRNSYAEYVATQRDKDAAAYSVKAALQRSDIFDGLKGGWITNSKLHFSGVALIEYVALIAELKMARFGLTGGWRNMAVFGGLDEMRHAQLNLFFAHELVAKDIQFDWCQKAYHTNNWAIISGRAVFDGFMNVNSAVDVALGLPFTFETGFSNLQFVALAANALESGDINFANMISSIQTDEARHAQQGGPTLQILMEQQPERAQWLIDRSFWLSARLFAIVTGPSMDYYTPLEGREQSYKEFMQEWIVDQFVTSLEDYGLKKPWYWDEFMDSLDYGHHSLAIGTWFYRWTLFYNPAGGVGKDERAWLCEKYPNWEENWGEMWDCLIKNINDGRPDLTIPATLPWVCNMCQLPNGTTTGPANTKYPLKPFRLTYNGYPLSFCSDPCRRIWWEDRNSMANQKTIVERLLTGEIQPPDLTGLFAYMGLGSEEMGDDPYNMAWAADYASG